MKSRLLPLLILALGLACASPTRAQSATSESRAAGVTVPDRDVVQRIREEGLERSQVMKLASHLTDVLGPRLTGSPELKAANEWTLATLTGWGLTNARLEPWPFGRGWSLQRFSAQIVEPYTIPLVARPRSWSTGFKKPITGPVVYFGATNRANLDLYKGQLKGAFVLTSPPRELPLPTEPLVRRLSETNLLRLANASPESGGFRRGRYGPPPGGAGTNAPAATNAATPPSRAGRDPLLSPRAAETFPNLGRRRPAESGGGADAGGGGSGPLSVEQKVRFLFEEGVAGMVSCTTMGDSGTILVGSANVLPARGATNLAPAFFGTRVSAWSTNAGAAPPQIVLGAEDYNRLVRMLNQGVALRLEADLRVEFHTKDLMAYNTLAEIPGADRADEIVLLGAHLDSYHGGTGATDNAAGVAVVMEAVRILRALDLKPRRTVRVGLWAGEEQGLLGSRAYARAHVGSYTSAPRADTQLTAAEAGGAGRPRGGGERQFVPGPEFEKLSVYFNLDNGAGKIRGIYLQGNEAVRPIFRKWLDSFRDLGAETVTSANTGSTDHIAFDELGVPGFQFIQDPLDYDSRTHHTTADVYDRFVADDLKQAATIMAAFAYNAAMLDERLPRKPAPAR